MNMLCIPVGPLQANCYVLWEHAPLACVVDPGGEPERILEAVQENGLTVDAVLVTHGHFDHVDGVAGVACATDATVYCSKEVVPIVAGSAACSATGLAVPGVPENSIEVVREGSRVKVGDLGVNVIATPGHTPGDVTYEIGGAIFCGDLLFSGSVGRTDFPGGDFATLVSSIRRLAEKYPPETRVYPGHMESTTLGQELKSNPFLQGLLSDG